MSSFLTDQVKIWAEESDCPREWLWELAEHGCASGACGDLVYTKDAFDRYVEHETEVLDILDEIDFEEAYDRYATLAEIATKRIWAAVEYIAANLTNEE